MALKRLRRVVNCAYLVTVAGKENRRSLVLLTQIVIGIVHRIGERIDVLVVLGREVDEAGEGYCDFRVERAMSLRHVAKDLFATIRQMAIRRLEPGVGGERKLAQKRIDMFQVLENQPAFRSTDAGVVLIQYYLLIVDDRQRRIHQAGMIAIYFRPVLGALSQR